MIPTADRQYPTPNRYEDAPPPVRPPGLSYVPPPRPRPTAPVEAPPPARPVAPPPARRPRRTPHRALTPAEDAALRPILRLPDAERAAAYAALAERFGVDVRVVLNRAWWLRTEMQENPHE